MNTKLIESFDIVESALECLSEDVKTAIVKQSLRSAIRDTVRTNAGCRPDDLLSRVAEKLQRRMTPEGSHAFTERVMNAGIDCRKPVYGRGAYPVDKIADILSLGHMLTPERKPSHKF